MEAIILAAGRGTRMRGLCDARPKPMLPLANVPLLDLAVDRFARAGVRKVFVVVGHHAERIQEHYARVRPPIPVDLSQHSRFLLMKLSFVVGAVHLSVAQLWRALAVYPDLRFLNRLGWAVFIWGMLGVVLFFVLRSPMAWDTPWPYFLIVGATMAILFASPCRNVPKMLGLGIADFPLSLLAAFSDVISYVRLMAVGLASSVLAVNFNEMARSAGPWPLMIAILLFGHGLNLGLAMIALFAHGVRLNMLEFSNNLGMQWTGYAYDPVFRRTIREHAR